MYKIYNTINRLTIGKSWLMAGLFFATCCFLQPAIAKVPAEKASNAMPENGLGGITGKITGDLKPLGKVVVVLMQNNKVIDQTETDEDGFYKFRYIEEGRYEIKATKDGHRTCVVTRIPVAPDKVTKLDFYQPRINNEHMDSEPIVETFSHYYKLMDYQQVSYPR